MNTHTIAHTTWNCKYHVVFTPKYRRKAFYGGRRLEIRYILVTRKFCFWVRLGFFGWTTFYVLFFAYIFYIHILFDYS